MTRRAFAVSVLGLAVVAGRGQAPIAAGSPSLLSRDQAAAILPPSVFFRGQTAPIQGRNSSGLKFAGDRYMLVAMVDTSGYSSALQQTYQAYLLTEEPIQFGDQRLAPGAYGFGFVAGDKFVCQDIGGHSLLSIASQHDTAITRPNPMQILPAAEAGHYRLYSGRNFVDFMPIKP